ncbi:Hsp20/alpha crystallin family protein [Sciscionella sediminilitoris]|uniref:Hsp20/alpha crystallin family protein n=1 Tax=Sciscionella sediminilitoris TaxID=1445613 RepID=UPI0004DEDF95|nr:Hsp20/alpha crystallin family protein [Sciscionella sp. SE31]
MLLRTEPFRELDRLFFNGQGGPGRNTGWTGRTGGLAMDAYAKDGEYVLSFDLPGVAEDAIEVKVERNVLTVKAERTPEYGEDAKVQIAERRRGTQSRQVFLGETLDTDNITADYQAGVLTLRIPIVEQAKARTIAVNGGKELAN